MSIEPTCDFCGVSVKPRCRSAVEASGCSIYEKGSISLTTDSIAAQQAAQQSDAVEIAEHRRFVPPDFFVTNTPRAGEPSGQRGRRADVLILDDVEPVRPSEMDKLMREYLDGLDKRAEELAATMPGDSKPSNPKDMIAVTKAPMHLVPSTIKALAAMSFAEGASKYGAYNWRVAGVRASVYKSALERHLEKWWNGEDVDPVTGVPHLASVIACAGIIADADLVGKLTDDRPPKAPIGGLFDATEGVVSHLYRINADKNPYHYTIKDSA